MGDPAEQEVDEAEDHEGFGWMRCDDDLNSRHEGGSDGDRLDSGSFGREDRFGLHGIWMAMSK